MRGQTRIVQFAILVFVLSQIMASQQRTTPPADPLQLQVTEVQLNDQSIVDGIAIVTRGAGLAVSVEYQLGATISGPAPSLKTFTTSIGPGTLSEVLDRLCALDPTFTWIRGRNTVNVLPRALADDPNYLLNRKIEELTFREVQKADDAVMDMVGQLSGPRQQIAVLQVGMSLNLARPWTVTLKDVTVRDVFDEIARQLGSTYGWQFSGAQDFRVITFHELLSPRPNRSKQTESAIGPKR